MTTDVLLLAGVAAAVLFVAVLLVEGFMRRGYDPAYHVVSELELGERGWVQRVSFLVMGVGTFAFAVGVQQTLGTTLGSVLLAAFAFGSVLSGVFTPDPVRGYPPGAPVDREAGLTWQAQVHDAAGPIMFLALLAACVVVAGRLEGGWRLYTILTAVVGLALMVWTVVSYQRDAARLGLVQRGLILVCWSWIVALGIHLTMDPPQL